MLGGGEAEGNAQLEDRQQTWSQKAAQSSIASVSFIALNGENTEGSR